MVLLQKVSLNLLTFPFLVSLCPHCIVHSGTKSKRSTYYIETQTFLSCNRDFFYYNQFFYEFIIDVEDMICTSNRCTEYVSTYLLNM